MSTQSGYKQKCKCKALWINFGHSCHRSTCTRPVILIPCTHDKLNRLRCQAQTNCADGLLLPTVMIYATNPVAYAVLTRSEKGQCHEEVLHRPHISPVTRQYSLPVRLRRPCTPQFTPISPQHTPAGIRRVVLAQSQWFPFVEPSCHSVAEFPAHTAQRPFPPCRESIQEPRAYASKPSRRTVRRTKRRCRHRPYGRHIVNR